MKHWQLVTEFFSEADFVDGDIIQIDSNDQTIDAVYREMQGFPVVDAFVASGLVKSKNQARKLIQQGGAYINNCRITDINTRLTESDLVSESIIVLRKGKKDYAILRFK